MNYRLSKKSKDSFLKFTISIGILFLLCLVFVPGEVSAAGIVKCGMNTAIDSNGSNGGLCQACDLFILVNTLIDWLTIFLTGVLTLIIIVAGFKMLTSQGNVGQVDSARRMIINGIIGFFIVLGSWLFVDTIFSKLTTGGGIAGFGIECVERPQAPIVVAPPGPGAGGTVTPGSCNDCSNLPSNIPTNGNACSLEPCQMNSTMASRLEAAGVVNGNAAGLRVSEAWPPAGYTPEDPSGVHAAQCHGTATCVDVSFSGTPSGTQVQNFINQARQNNLTAVYEVQTQERANELRGQGVTNNIIVLPTINREHFSVYMCDVDPSPRACGG